MNIIHFWRHTLLLFYSIKVIFVWLNKTEDRPRIRDYLIFLCSPIFSSVAVFYLLWTIIQRKQHQHIFSRPIYSQPRLATTIHFELRHYFFFDFIQSPNTIVDLSHTISHWIKCHYILLELHFAIVKHQSNDLAPNFWQRWDQSGNVNMYFAGWSNLHDSLSR